MDEVQGQLRRMNFLPHWTEVLNLRTQTQKVVVLNTKIFWGGNGFYHIILGLLYSCRALRCLEILNSKSVICSVGASGINLTPSAPSYVEIVCDHRVSRDQGSELRSLISFLYFHSIFVVSSMWLNAMSLAFLLLSSEIIKKNIDFPQILCWWLPLASEEDQ